MYEKYTEVQVNTTYKCLQIWKWLCWVINVVVTCSLSVLIIVILVSIEFKTGTGAVFALLYLVMVL